MTEILARSRRLGGPRSSHLGEGLVSQFCSLPGAGAALLLSSEAPIVRPHPRARARLRFPRHQEGSPLRTRGAPVKNPRPSRSFPGPFSAAETEGFRGVGSPGDRFESGRRLQREKSRRENPSDTTCLQVVVFAGLSVIWHPGPFPVHSGPQDAPRAPALHGLARCRPVFRSPGAPGGSKAGCRSCDERRRPP